MSLQLKRVHAQVKQHEFSCIFELMLAKTKSICDHDREKWRITLRLRNDPDDIFALELAIMNASLQQSQI